jgi:hypothetical protein
MTTNPDADADELRVRHYLRDLGVSHTPATPEDDWWTSLYGPETKPLPVEDEPGPSRWQVLRDRATTWGERQQKTPTTKPETEPESSEDPDDDRPSSPAGERPPKRPAAKKSPAAAWYATLPGRTRWTASTAAGAVLGYGLGLQPAMTGWITACAHDQTPTAALVLAAGLIATSGYLAHRTRGWWPPLAWACRIPLATAILATALYAPGATS